MEYIIALGHLGQLLAGDAHKYQVYLCTCNRTIDNWTAIIACLFQAQASLNFRKFHSGDLNLDLLGSVSVLSHIFKKNPYLLFEVCRYIFQAVGSL